MFPPPYGLLATGRCWQWPAGGSAFMPEPARGVVDLHRSPGAGHPEDILVFADEALVRHPRGAAAHAGGEVLQRRRWCPRRRVSPRWPHDRCPTAPSQRFADKESIAAARIGATSRCALGAVTPWRSLQAPPVATSVWRSSSGARVRFQMLRWPAVRNWPSSPPVAVASAGDEERIVAAASTSCARAWTLPPRILPDELGPAGVRRLWPP